MGARPARAERGAGTVLLTLAAGQFLMALDSSVMNVSIATVASDLGTTVTGVQTAITLYTLVMAMFMITGGKIGGIVGRRRAFSIGCVIYGCGSVTTSLAPNVGVLIFGWSFLEGMGAVLILPAIVALVASNFAPSERPRAFGLVMSAGAIAVAAGPLIGGLVTTYLSWRWVFVGEVLIVLTILVLARSVADTPAHGPHLDLVGTVLSAAGLGLFVFGVLRSSAWGWVQPKPSAPSLFGVSPGVAGAGRRGRAVGLLWLGASPSRAAPSRLLDPAMLDNRQLRGGLTVFFFQYLLQGGLFFAVPLFLSVALGLSALQTGVRLLPLSATLLLAAAGVPRVFPQASPRRVVQIGLLCLFAGSSRAGRARRRRRPGDHHLADAPGRSRHRRARLTARRRDRVFGPRRAKQRGRRGPEHLHQLGRVARHGPGRLGAHSALTAAFLSGMQNTRRPEGGHDAGDNAVGRRRPVHLRPGPSGRTR